MKNSSIADRLAEKSFETPAVQKAWRSHCDVFGPILEPAFANDAQSRVHLINALNAISRKEINKAIPLLQKIGKNCRSDADRAAILYFTGLACEFAGHAEEAMEFYLEANEYGHAFYMPYLKVAKDAYVHGAYDPAEENFRKAMDCLDTNTDANRMILASTQANFASCLIMMHRFDEAQAALDIAEKLMPDQANHLAVEVTLHAAKGEEAAVYRCLQALEQSHPQLYASVKPVAEKTLEGKNPQFASVELEKVAVNSFWRWFSLNESRLSGMLKREEYAPAVDEIISVLKPMFAFSEHEMQMSLGKSDHGHVLVFIDFYSTALHDGYVQLINACPDDVPDTWGFDVVH